jgi:predicted DCC family thiol-disulfide oxidoreductase YuxK
LQSRAAVELRKSKNISEDSVVYFSGNRYFQKSDAILGLLNDLGGGWRFFGVLRLIPRRWRDYIYDIIARNRYRIFGRMESCMVPSPEIKERFIL